MNDGVNCINGSYISEVLDFRKVTTRTGKKLFKVEILLQYDTMVIQLINQLLIG